MHAPEQAAAAPAARLPGRAAHLPGRAGRLLRAVGPLLLIVVAAGCGMLRGTPAAKADISVITHGDEVDLTAHLAPGKFTVFDFYAIWCPPCRALSPALERLATEHPDRLAIRKVDIVDWTMPVAEQYRVVSLPYLILYGPDGRRQAEGDAVFRALGDLFGDAALPVGESVGVEAGAAPGGQAPDPDTLPVR